MKVFVDTSAWISLVATGDPHHEAVAGEWKTLLSGGASPVTSSDVLTETITFLRYRAGHAAAVEFWRLVDAASREGRLTVRWVGETLFKQAWRTFLDYDDQEFSMADCTSFAICRRERIAKALTLDRHFRTAGIETLPARA